MVALAAAVLLPACAAAVAPAPAYAQATAIPKTPALVEPMVIRSDPATGVLKARLEVVWRTFNVPTGFTTYARLPLRTWRVLEANGISYADSNKVGFPGPTFRVRRGDSVNITLINNLTRAPLGTDTACVEYPAAYTTDRFQDCFHGSNWTNIHYHGMHVTPDPRGDDVLLQIPPGGSHEYGFRIPANQSPGTHWYHPHKHGSVAVQVMNGMAGAFIVEGGGLDSLAAQSRMAERLIAIQQIGTEPNLMHGGRVAMPTLVNGQYTPTIYMAPGEVQRWRIVNENISKSSNFALFFKDTPGAEPSFYDVARDGVQYAPANYHVPGQPLRADSSLIMAPGNRLDAFVQAPGRPGVFAVHGAFLAHLSPNDRTRKDDLDPGPGEAVPAAAVQARERMEGQGQGQGQGRRRAQAAAPAAPPQIPLFYVVVDSTQRSPSRLPDALPPLPRFLDNLSGNVNPDSMPVVVFADSGFATKAPEFPTDFFLGTAQNPRMQFSDSVYVPRLAGGGYRPMVLGQTQTWKVVNESAATNHPFHIHINPFQVLDLSFGSSDPNAPLYRQLQRAAQGGNPVWLDVLPLPVPFTNSSGATVPGYAIIRQAYEPFRNADGSICERCGPPTGWFVMHCHILGHEERGMMQLLEVIPPGGQVGPVPENWITGGNGHGAPAHRH
jgi:FtsP/CotA-like multicopper oxidase with cupredoxin domain